MMKPFAEPRLWGLLATALMALALTACGNGDGVEAITQPEEPALDQQATKVNVVTRNAKSGERIPTSVTVTGPDAGSVVNGQGEPDTSFDATNGLANFAFAEGATPSEADPLQVTVVARAQGFVSNSQRLVLTEAGLRPVTIRLVNVDDTPAGIGAAVDDTAQAAQDGQIVQDLEIETPRESDGEQVRTARFRVPQGTIARDAEGNPVEGQLTTSVAYHDSGSEEALDVFPGGLGVAVNTQDPDTPQEVVNQGGEGSFISAGFVSIDMQDASGREVETFDTPVEVAMEVPQGTTNPDTGQPVQNGDILPIWSYDEATGEWTFEGNGTATGPNAQGNFEVTIQTDHLSYWNADWFADATCDTEIQLQGADERPLTVRLRAQSVNYVQSFPASAGDPRLVVLNVPAGRQTDITARLDSTGEQVGSRTVSTLCAIPINLPVSLPPAPTGTVEVTVEEECPDGSNTRVVSSTNVTLDGFGGEFRTGTTDGEGFVSFANLDTGSGILSVENRRTGNLVDREVTIDTPGATVTVTVTLEMECETITGGA